MITSGVLLMERDALRPRCFAAGACSHPNAWISIQQTLTPRQLEKELSETGWTFFFMAGLVRTTAFGFNRDKRLEAALKRSIQAVKQQKCNCLQIEAVEAHSFLGIPYVSMSVRPRHIQKGLIFGGPSFGDSAGTSVPESGRKVAAA